MFALYVATGIGSQWLASLGGLVAAVWPPFAIGTAGLVRWGRPYLAVVLVAEATIGVSLGLPWPLVVAISLGNSASILLAATLLSPRGASLSFSRLPAVGRLLQAAIVGPIPAALVGPLALQYGDLLDGPYRDYVWAWWLTDTVAALVMVPALLLPAAQLPRGRASLRTWGILLAVALASAIAFFVPAGPLARSTLAALLFPVLLAVAAWRRVPDTALATVVVAAVGIFSLAWAKAGPAVHLLDLQVILALEAAGALAVAVAMQNVEDTSRRGAAADARAQAAAEQARFRREFIAGAAHEIGNALSPIRVGLSMQRLAGQPASAAVEHGVERIAALVHDLQVVAVHEAVPAPALRSIDLADLARQAAARATPAAQVAHVTLAVEGEAAPVAADAMRLEQVFDNLVSNAIKYSPDGGTVVVQVHAGGGQVRVDVRDQGLGFSADQRDRMFNPFSRVHRVERPGIPGTGLGLHIVRQIIEGLGGSVGAESNGPGKGSTFWFSLPAGPGPSVH